MADVMSAFLQGHGYAQAEKEHQQALDENKLRTMVLKHQIDSLKVEDAIRARSLQQQNLQLLEGQPEANLPTEAAPHAPNEPPAQVGLRSMVGDLVRRNGAVESESTTGTSSLAPVPLRQRAAVTIPGVPDLGVGDVSVRPRSMEELLRAQMAAKLNEPYTLAEGARRYVGGQEVARGGSKEIVIPRGGTLVKPDDPTAAPMLGQPAASRIQSKNMLLDGQPAAVTLDLDSKKWFDANNVEIAEPAKHLRPLPPAAIQVSNATAADLQNAPDVDASRPDPTTANKVDPKTGMTPNGVYQAALEHALKGTLPNLGYGQSPRATAVRMGVINKASAIAAAAGTDLPTVQAEYKANSATLNKLLPMATATAAAAGTANDNLQLALDQSDKVTRTGSKLANRYLQWVQGNLTAAKGLTQFETYIYTAAREYAKVTSGSSASSQGLTDSAAREAEKLLNAAQAPEAFSAAVTAMQNDMGNVVKNQAKALAGVSSTIANFFSVANGGGPVTAETPASAGSGGVIEAKDPQGGIHHAPAGTPLPAGWTLVTK